MTKRNAPTELYTDISVFGLRTVYVVVRTRIVTLCSMVNIIIISISVYKIGVPAVLHPIFGL